MCSIVGYVGDTNRKKISAMLTATAHRGPDDKGIYINGNIGLGHNRLSIIDLSSKGRQPMFDEEKSICIVFNGEIYNFLELKKQLQKDYRFRTDTDTEVIIYAYKKWGFNCLKRLNGMFAFVIYDLKKNLLFGARDRLGEKPLKYYFDNNIFVFASEVKGILPALRNRPEIDYQAINDYLTLQYVPTPKTGFENIYKLPPAHYFIFKDKKLTIKRYWNLDFSQKLDLSEKEWVDLLEDKINLAVSERMISDVPLGALLSGGIDSAAVVAFMAKNSNKRVKTFSIGFTEPEFDETECSRKVSQKYNTDHSDIKVDSKIFKEIFTEMSDYYDEPFADNSLMPTIFLSKFARRKIKVALSGDGGDENFAGYDRYGVVSFSKIFHTIPRDIRNQLIKPTANTIFRLLPSITTQRLMTYVNIFDQPFYKKYLYYRCFLKKNEKHNLYSNSFKRIIGKNDTFLIYKNDFNRKLDDVDNALKFDIDSYLPEDLLFKVDIASMRHGLEIRAPLLDYKLMELSAQIPPDLKVRFFNKKYVFKKMLIEKDILPRNIVNRPKKGFVAPIKKWLKNDLKDYVYEELDSSKFRQMEIFDDGKLDVYIKEYFSSKVDYSNNIFAILALANWINKYF